MRCCNPRLYPITFITIPWIGQVHARVTVPLQCSSRTHPYHLPSGIARVAPDPNASLNANIASSSSSSPRDPRSIEGTSTRALARSRFQLGNHLAYLQPVPLFVLLLCCDDDVLFEVTGLAELRVTLTRSVIGDVMPLDDEPRSVATCHSRTQPSPPRPRALDEYIEELELGRP